MLRMQPPSASAVVRIASAALVFAIICSGALAEGAAGPLCKDQQAASDQVERQTAKLFTCCNAW